MDQTWSVMIVQGPLLKLVLYSYVKKNIIRQISDQAIKGFCGFLNAYLSITDSEVMLA